MCGISGVLNAATQFNNKIDKFISDATVANVVRGFDSTGIMQQDRKGQTFVHKLPLIGGYFVGDKLTREFLKDADKCFVTAVHNRAATQGKVNARNAHPFAAYRDDDPENKGNESVIVGMHNGSLRNWSWKDQGKEFDVDSEWALNRIAAVGLDAFKDIEGPYAFVWTDSLTPGKVYMARNSERPMHLRLSKDKKQLYFCSEAGMLSWITDRNEIECEPEIMILETGRIYTFDCTGSTVTWKKELLPSKANTPPAAGAGNSASAPASSTKPSLSYAAQGFLAKIEKAANALPKSTASAGAAVPLADAVDKAVSELVDAVGDGNAKSATETIVELTQQREDDSPRFQQGQDFIDKVPTGWYSDRTAGTAERGTAIDWGVYRELYWFEGITFDPETGETWGDISMFDNKLKEHVKYTALVRGLNAHAAAQLINPVDGKIGDWVVAIGAREDRMMGRTIICTGLTPTGRARLEEVTNPEAKTGTVH